MHIEIPYLIFFTAIALGCGLALYFFFRGRSPGDAFPAAKSNFEKYGKVRLRDLFRLAVMLEEKGNDFYLKMGMRVKSPETKKLCLWLAEEELKHRQFMQDHLDKWRPLPTHLTEWPAFLEKVRREGFFEDAPGDAATEPELAAYAVKQEALTVRFYAGFESSFPDFWKRSRLGELVQEELTHEARLRAAYPSLK